MPSPSISPAHRPSRQRPLWDAAGVALMAALFAGLPGAASAQSGKAPAPTPAAPVGAEPGSTSASYGDWVLRCQRIGEGDKAQRVCEVAQMIQVQNRRDPIAEIALGRLATDSALRLTAALPPSVSFPSTVEVASATGDAAVQLQWRRCVPGGCFADGVPGDEALRAWRGSTGGGKLTFKDAGGHAVTLPLSFRGLAQALDALAKA